MSVNSNTGFIIGYHNMVFQTSTKIGYEQDRGDRKMLVWGEVKYYLEYFTLFYLEFVLDLHLYVMC